MPEINQEEIKEIKNVFKVPRLNKGTTIRRLYLILKNIETVSCLFRFIEPSSYGILSPPVADLLNIRGKDDVKMKSKLVFLILIFHIKMLD